MQKYVNETYGFKYGLPTVDLLMLFPNFTEVNLEDYCSLAGSSSVSDLAVVKLFSGLYKPCHCLQIGVWRGESLNNLDCDLIVGLDLPASRLTVNSGFRDSIGLLIDPSKPIHLIREDSLTYDFSQLNNKFDIIIIDGDHKKSSITHDTKNMLNLLRNRDSIILWHDYCSSFERVMWEVFAGILDGVPKELHNNLYHISNTNYAMLSFKDYPSKFVEFPAMPTIVFDVSIKLRKL